ncbi:ShlB/FhaC/HecB family hemolysin secretion/activation protein [Sphingomonas sp. HF-S3]|uniref:ShlB/FhaC/HecB family hemolysin secretion/activation protein n=1 Tax=Sphingomonas rustica TaxID=3103142 RepID=A0ABV0BHK0_9SPHN
MSPWASQTLLRGTLTAGVLLAVSPAHGQALPGSLPSRQQVEAPRVPDSPPPSSLTVRDDRPRPARCAFAGSTLSVAIDRLRFTAADGGPLPDPVRAALAQIRPTPGLQPLDQLCALRDAAASALGRRGYVAGVTIPPQEIVDGEARLSVVLARLTEIRITGDPGPHGRTLTRRAQRLIGLPVLDTAEIESVLMGANDVPGLQATLVLAAAGTVPGEVIGELTVTHMPWLVVANAQNSGARALGRESATIRAEIYGLTGHADRTYLGLSSTFDLREQRVVQIGHSMATDGGATLGARFSYAWSRPDLGGLDLRARSMIAGLDLSVPLARGVRGRSEIGGGVELVEQQLQLGGGDVGGSVPVSRDRLRVAYLRMGFDRREPRFSGIDRWSLSGSFELRQGLDLFGATQGGVVSGDGYAPSRFDASATATVARGSIDATFSAGPVFSLSVQAQGQWASGPLFSFEEYAVGNLTIGRGYDPGIAAGDGALAFRIEPRADLPWGSPAVVQAFAFLDAAQLWNRDELSDESGNRLRSLGLGIRGWLPGRLAVEAIYARPLDPELRFPGARRAGDRLLLSLTAQFAPRR